jgi:GntR family transcriptional regulator, transcriptional repressor for pyruvate dehydrogenase complex
VITATKGKTTRRRRPQDSATGAMVVEHVRRLIEDGQLRRGDRLPPERELALQVGVSRPSLRYGLRTLQAMGVIRARQGSGTFVADGPPRLSEGPLRFLAALHGISRDEMFQARRVLEVGAAGLAAEHADPEQMARMAEEVASMFAAMDSPQEFLVHDVQFHRAVAAASGNRILSTLIDTVAELVYEVRRTTVERAKDLRESAEMHRRIYRAVKAGDPERARREMAEHLDLARQAQAREEVSERPRGVRAPAPSLESGGAGGPAPAPRRPRS